jgi:adenylate kinase family enzyme
MARNLGKAEDRSAAAVEALKKRVSTFKEQTKPVIDMYN